MYTEPIGGRDMISTFLWRETCEEATMPHMKGILFFSNSKYPSFFFLSPPSKKLLQSYSAKEGFKIWR